MADLHVRNTLLPSSQASSSTASQPRSMQLLSPLRLAEVKQFKWECEKSTKLRRNLHLALRLSAVTVPVCKGVYGSGSTAPQPAKGLLLYCPQSWKHHSPHACIWHSPFPKELKLKCSPESSLLVIPPQFRTHLMN